MSFRCRRSSVLVGRNRRHCGRHDRRSFSRRTRTHYRNRCLHLLVKSVGPDAPRVNVHDTHITEDVKPIRLIYDPILDKSVLSRQNRIQGVQQTQRIPLSTNLLTSLCLQRRVVILQSRVPHRHSVHPQSVLLHSN